MDREQRATWTIVFVATALIAFYIGKQFFAPKPDEGLRVAIPNYVTRTELNELLANFVSTTGQLVTREEFEKRQMVTTTEYAAKVDLESAKKELLNAIETTNRKSTTDFVDEFNAWQQNVFAPYLNALNGRLETLEKKR